MKPITLVALIASFAIGSAALAEDTAPKKDAKDPNRIICKSEDVLGSRLQKNKRCQTAAEWDAERRNNRNMIEHSQERFKNN